MTFKVLNLINSKENILISHIYIICYKYQLGAVVHLGRTVHAGHYISYVKRNNKWIYFNDRKVA